jgi:hypothetical protein
MRNEVHEALTILNEAVEGAAVGRDPIMMAFNGRPSVRVTELESAAIEVEFFGTFRNRAPKIVGNFVMRSVIDGSPVEDRVMPIAVFRHHQTLYGEGLNLQQLSDLSDSFDLGVTWWKDA